MTQFLQQDQFPTEFALHKKYAQCDLLLELVWTHSVILMEVGLSLYESGIFDVSNIDQNVFSKSMLLHDIGVYLCGGFEWIPGQYPLEKSYAHHTIEGAKVLEQEGLRAEIVRVAQVHAGVGLTAEDIQKYGMFLPEADYMPATPLEWLATYTAKFHSKAPKFKRPAEIEESLQKYGADKADRFRQLQTCFGIPNIDAFEQKYATWHSSFQYKLQQLKEGGVGQSVITMPAASLNSAGISTSQPLLTSNPLSSVNPIGANTSGVSAITAPPAAAPMEITYPAPAPLSPA